MILRPERCVLGQILLPCKTKSRSFSMSRWDGAGAMGCSACAVGRTRVGARMPAERGRGAHLGRVWARAQGAGQLVGAPGGQEGTFPPKSAVRRVVDQSRGRKGQRVRGIRAPLSGREGLLV